MSDQTFSVENIVLQSDALKRSWDRSWIFYSECKLSSEQKEKFKNTNATFIYIESIRRFGISFKNAVPFIHFFDDHFKNIVKENKVTEEGLIQYFSQCIEKSSQLKKILVKENQAHRWIHGESDGIPGIVMDFYPPNQAVVRVGNQVGEFLFPYFQKSILKSRPSLSLFERSSGQSRQTNKLPERTRWLTQAQSSTEVSTKFVDLEFTFDMSSAQKTGLFLDQNHNLEIFKKLLTSGSTEQNSMLDICSYLGAWSTVAAHAGVYSVTLIDRDQKALNFAEKNIRKNSSKDVSVELLHGDLFEKCNALKKEGKKFDIVVCDPPAFAKSQDHVHQARKAYSQLLKAASALVSPGGIFVACSCSRNITEDDFLFLIRKNVPRAREWLLIEKGQQSPDHTVRLDDEFSTYLKCLFFKKRF